MRGYYNSAITHVQRSEESLFLRYSTTTTSNTGSVAKRLSPALAAIQTGFMRPYQ